MSIISASVFMIYIYSLFINIELYYEKSHYVTIGSAFASIINIVLNLIFIKKYGYIAAGYTTLVSYILLAILHYLFMNKILKKKNVNAVYNYKLIIGFGLMVTFVSIVIQFLYSAMILRYIVLMIFIIVIIINKNKVMSILKEIKSKGE